MSDVVIAVEDLKKSYGKHTVLESVTLNVNKGDIYGLIGKNGAGKTTLFKTLLGLSEYDSGKLSILGAKTPRENNHNRRKIGFFVGANFYGYLNAKQNMKYFMKVKGIKDKNEADRVLELVGLNTKAAEAPAERFSLGMKQRLGIANALLGNPEILIFDEPINGLDPQGIHDVRTLIEKINHDEGKTIIVSSHILSELEHTATRFGIVHNGVVLKELTRDDFRTQENVTSINVADQDVERAKQVLAQAGINVKGTEQARSSLEDFYFSLIGGEGNA
ncbi:MAG: ATP-binding cassette domain-containing protein [Lachnospiraceae bacterium]|nr:ATP-binding cassette domain-containing protein [Lachnospiraceae bacterium]